MFRSLAEHVREDLAALISLPPAEDDEDREPIHRPCPNSVTVGELHRALGARWQGIA